MPALVVLVGLAMVIVLSDAVRVPSFRRLAVRNILRRRNETILVILGSLLGTAIITASLVVGDTVEETERDVARTKLGEVDVIVSDPDAPGRVPELRAALAPETIEGVDGVLGVRRAGATAATVGDERLAEPFAGLVEVDFDAARHFGSDPSNTGLQEVGATPTGDRAVIGEDLADALDLEPGDPFDVFAYGASRRFVVRDVVPRVGLAGFGSMAARSRAPVVFVPAGTIDGLASSATRAAAQASRPEGMLLISGPGGVFDAGRDHSTEVALEMRARDLEGVQVAGVKREVLERAAAEGDSIGQLFTGIGGFSVIAGILLLVNIFVMLSEERKTEFGVLRAVGMKRNHLVRSFGMEGAIYSTVAAVAGGLVGIGVARLISIVANGIQNGGGERGVLEMRFAAQPTTVLTGILIGLLISMVTVWVTSVRIGRLNVIRAIRDLPEPARRGHSARATMAGLVGVAVGALLLRAGMASGSSLASMSGPPLALFSSVPLLSRFLPRRIAVTLPSTLALTWGVTAFGLLPEAFRSADIPVFVVQGVVLVGSAVAVLTVNTDLLGHAMERVAATGGGLAARLGLAYPLARRFRTGLLLGMFALVMFTLTFLAALANIFSAEGPRLAADESGGFDLVLDSARSNPVVVDELSAQPGVSAVAPLRQTGVKFTTAAVTEPSWWGVTGFDERMLRSEVPALSQRAGGFATDEEVWRRVLEQQPAPGEPIWAVVPEFFLQNAAGPPSNSVWPGQQITMIDPVSERKVTLAVAGMRETDFSFNGVMLPMPFVREFTPNTAVSRFLVETSPGAAPDEVAQRLNGAFLTKGADARTFTEIVDGMLATQLGFFRLIQGYLGLGLVIGIAGLGVVMVRAVRERRREIGMLRAMGFPSSTVRRSFLSEATFIALQGIVIGIGLGLVTAWSLLNQSEAFGGQELPFRIPWGSLVVVFAVPLAASLLAVAAPAHAASRIRPAVALRVTD